MSLRAKKIQLALKEPKYIKRAIANNITSFMNLDYRVLKGKSFYPHAVVIIPTYRCNLRCKTCFLINSEEEWIPRDLKDCEGELGINEWKRIIDQVSIFKPHFYVVGGEPLLYKDILEFISYIKTTGSSCSLTTNGTLLGSIAADLVKTKIDKITISLDGPKYIHNKIRGASSFERAIDGLKKIVGIREKASEISPLIGLNCVISPDNYQWLNSLFDITRHIPLDFINYQHMQFSDQKRVQAHERLFKDLFGFESRVMEGFLDDSINDNNINANLLLNILGQLKNGKNTCAINIIPEIDDINEYYTNLEHRFPRNRCLSPWRVARILPNGDICACFGHPDYIIGNLREEDFAQIWNKPSFIDFRQKLKENRLFPGCLRCCKREY
jgi:radical SAM protein with 4Fe4S-binding SPASM domain